MQRGNFLKGVFSPSRTYIGLDIGNFNIKIAQVKKRRFSKERVLSFAIVPIGGDKSKDRIIEAIKEACKNLGLDSKKVNLSIAGPCIMMRYIIIPSMSEKELSQSLEVELEKYIPYKGEDVVVDHRILTKLSDNQILVLLVAAERKLINERVNLIKDAGLEPQLINVDALALIEAFRVILPRPKGVVAILDIGYQLSKLVVMEDDIPYFSRDIETGEYDIIQMISEKMNIDFDLAKEWGYHPKDKLKEITEIVKPGIDNLLDELFLSFEYCERNLEKKVEQLYLSGGGSKVKVLLESIEKNPNLKIDFWESTQGFKISPSITNEELKEYSPLLAVAIGLALS